MGLCLRVLLPLCSLCGLLSAREVLDLSDTPRQYEISYGDCQCRVCDNGQSNASKIPAGRFDCMYFIDI